MNKNESIITPMDLLGARTVYTNRQVPEVVKATGRTIYWNDLVTINIESVHLAVNEDKIPGILINKEDEDNKVFVTMEDTSLYTDRNACLNVIKGINANVSAELDQMLVEKLKEYNEIEKVKKMVDDIILNTK